VRIIQTTRSTFWPIPNTPGWDGPRYRLTLNPVNAESGLELPPTLRGENRPILHQLGSPGAEIDEMVCYGVSGSPDDSEG